MPEPKPEEMKFVNVLMPKVMVEKLEAMAETDDADRSKFIRRLIATEWNRRQKATNKLKEVGQPQSSTQ